MGRGQFLGVADLAGCVFARVSESRLWLSTSGFPLRLRQEPSIDWKFPGLPEKTW
jgi:hypothetical protein